MFEISIKKLSRVLLDDHRNLPEGSGIYFLIDNAMRVWYVGISNNLRKRHTQHEKIELFKESGCTWIAYLQYGDMGDLIEWGRCYIEKLDPPLNTIHKTSLPLTDLGYEKSKYIERYQEIKLMISALEREVDELKPNIVSIIEDHGGRIKTGKFNAYLVERPVYKYSSEVESLRVILKEKELQEKENGIASIHHANVFPVIRHMK
jgi:hypothetical protein